MWRKLLVRLTLVSFSSMGLFQYKNWRNPAWLTKKQESVCKDLFDKDDPLFGTDQFIEYLAEELLAYMCREYGKLSTDDISRDELKIHHTRLALLRNTLYTLHTALNTKILR